MTIKEYLKTLKGKDIIVIEPDIFGARGGKCPSYVNSVRNLLKLDPPALECEYDGSSDINAVNGMKGRLIIYKTSKSQVSSMKPIRFDRLANAIASDDVVTAVADYLEF